MKFRKAAGVILFYVLVVSIFIAITCWGSMATTVIAQKIPMEREHRIIIDAGHGGEDGGATSCTGILESTYNLEIALKLRDMFHFLGYDTVMTRTTDTSIYTTGSTLGQKKVSDLKERVRIVNETEDGVLVSIHQNTFFESQYTGAQIFYGPKGESRELAVQMQTAFGQSVNPGSSRKAKPADGIYLMQHIDCTGVLIECGFLSNPEEAVRLRDPQFQKKLCCVIASSVSNFLDQ